MGWRPEVRLALEDGFPERWQAAGGAEKGLHADHRHKIFTWGIGAGDDDGGLW